MLKLPLKAYAVSFHVSSDIDNPPKELLSVLMLHLLENADRERAGGCHGFNSPMSGSCTP